MNNIQQYILERLFTIIGKQTTKTWLLTRNIHFNNNTPINYLLSGNYMHFDKFIHE